ncbi:hypothetical protein K438DRAFT_1946705 [Mycena galopus ATCC 62051]|nr:hypothetical protein K438DRAFT_1946705 [Mycena galopus ATCC 62051]
MRLPAVSTVELVASWGSLGEFVPVAVAVRPKWVSLNQHHKSPSLQMYAVKTSRRPGNRSNKTPTLQDIQLAAQGSHMRPQGLQKSRCCASSTQIRRLLDPQVLLLVPRPKLSCHSGLPVTLSPRVPHFSDLCTLDYHKDLMAIGKHSMCSFVKGVRSRDAFGIELVAKLRDLGLEQCYAGVGSLEAWKTRSEHVKVARQSYACLTIVKLRCVILSYSPCF